MITDRIKQIMERHHLSAVAFAEKVGIERSGLSHLFSGRNKPSLELILKITDAFPDISLDWLLKGISSADKQANLFLAEKSDEAGINKDDSTANFKDTGVMDVTLQDSNVYECKQTDNSFSSGKSGKTLRTDQENSMLKDQETQTRVEGIIVLRDDKTFTYYRHE